jgi:ubiquinone/menaquinone biosynthesis C-methylase UbiE
MEMARGYQVSVVVMALDQLEICTALAEYPAGATAQELAAKLGLHPRPLETLLAAAVAVGLLSSQEGRYSNTELSATCLVKGSAQYMGAQLKSAADQYLAWLNLPEAIRKGKTILPSLHNDAANDPALRRLILGLHSGGKQLAPKLLPVLAPFLEKARRLLDVGSGAGTFALAFAEAYLALEVTLLDQPAVLELAREVAGESSARDRVQYLSADYKTDDFGQSRYDLLLFFQVLRTESPATIRLLLGKAAQALTPNGVVVIYDTYLEDNRAAPVENVFQNLTLSLMYEAGGLFTPAELGGWLRETGFKPPRLYPVQAVRPMVLYLAERDQN